MNSVNKYGSPPYLIALLHGGPGAAGEMKPVADILSKNNSIIEPLQTEDTIDKQVLELFNQLSQCAEFPVISCNLNRIFMGSLAWIYICCSLSKIGKKIDLN